MRKISVAMVLLSLMLTGAIFGFFYAWVCSTMWGLDATDPRVAIVAMQAMNGSVRNAVFAPAFFGTPLALVFAAALLRSDSRHAASACFVLSALIYLCFGLALTMLVNVPMNEALAKTAIPDDIEGARQIWADYSGRWQIWNTLRAFASGISLLVAVWGLISASGVGLKTA